ncbi:protein DOG1-like 4 [Bidens hawaiensis]|uniref:protein DOG1-like 4 n=1 Tax=Bidens hawaiensis TaxID=980011 RepID=UPI00404918AD
MTEPKNTPPQIFHRFFDGWLVELNTNLQQLISAANNHNCDPNDSVLRLLIAQSVTHYEEYYRMKSVAAKGDVISMFSPTWLTSLEDAFLWIAGWRPTTVIHLLYSKSGIQFEASLTNLIIPVFTSDDLGGLSLSQINLVDELQKKTVREERNISEKMATVQESAADKSMVELSNVISEMMRKEGDESHENDGRVESALEPKTDGLEEVLHLADELRMATLKAVIEILTPIQAVHFLIGAAELRLRLHDWGLKRDAESGAS